MISPPSRFYPSTNNNNCISQTNNIITTTRSYDHSSYSSNSINNIIAPREVHRCISILSCGHIFTHHTLETRNCIHNSKKVVIFYSNHYLYICRYVEHQTRYKHPFMKIPLFGNIIIYYGLQSPALKKSSAKPKRSFAILVRKPKIQPKLFNFTESNLPQSSNEANSNRLESFPFNTIDSPISNYFVSPTSSDPNFPSYFLLELEAPGSGDMKYWIKTLDAIIKAQHNNKKTITYIAPQEDSIDNYNDKHLNKVWNRLIHAREGATNIDLYRQDSVRRIRYEWEIEWKNHEMRTETNCKIKQIEKIAQRLGYAMDWNGLQRIENEMNLRYDGITRIKEERRKSYVRKKQKEQLIQIESNSVTLQNTDRPRRASFDGVYTRSSIKNRSFHRSNSVTNFSPIIPQPIPVYVKTSIINKSASGKLFNAITTNINNNNMSYSCPNSPINTTRDCSSSRSNCMSYNPTITSREFDKCVPIVDNISLQDNSLYEIFHPSKTADAQSYLYSIHH